MTSGLIVFDQIISVVRYTVLAVAVIFAVFCLIDWLVRTRRVNLFGSLARFCRSKIDPVLEPIERKVVGAGGNPQHAPLWGLAAVVIGGILLISILDFIRAQVIGLAFASRGGAMGLFELLVGWTFDILRLALMVRVISSFLPVSPYSKWVRWSYVLSEPILKPLRAVIPTIGPFDITPIIAFILLGFLQDAVLRLL